MIGSMQEAAVLTSGARLMYGDRSTVRAFSSGLSPNCSTTSKGISLWQNGSGKRKERRCLSERTCAIFAALDETDLEWKLWRW